MSAPNEVACQIEWLKGAWEVAKAIPSAVTAVIAYKAFQIGKTYFNKGQENALALNTYSKCIDVLNGLHSCLVEHKRICNELLGEKTTTSQIEEHLRHNADCHNEAKASSMKAQFVDGIDDVRTKYFQWYNKWFVDSEERGLVPDLLDDSRRSKTIQQIGKPLISEVEELISEIKTIKSSQKPDTQIGK